jgi:excisionase family DNA binding protein|tara:strand:- start:960 stop:1145 length:186 start_codon:yes stop_codon:yes gene_type:complete
MKYKNYYTITETASMLKVSENTIYRMARRGDIEGTKIGRQWRFSEESLKNMQKTSTKKNHY